MDVVAKQWLLIILTKKYECEALSKYKKEFTFQKFLISQFGTRFWELFNELQRKLEKNWQHDISDLLNLQRNSTTFIWCWHWVADDERNGNFEGAFAVPMKWVTVTYNQLNFVFESKALYSQWNNFSVIGWW